MTDLRTNELDGRRVAYSSETEFLVQVGRGRAEWLIDELSTAWENAASESFWRKLAEDCRDVLTLAEYRAVTR